VVGSRDFGDYELLDETLDRLTAKFANGIDLHTGGNYTEADGEYWPRVVEHGRVRHLGADYGAYQWGLKRGLKKKVVVHVHHAEWDEYGKQAGPVRNSKMVKAAGADAYMVAFWDGESKGTEDAIKKARKLFRENRIKIIEVA
jgi:hypothetical protein